MVAGRTKSFELLEVIAPIEGMKADVIKRKDNDYHIKLSEMPLDNSLKDKELIVRTNLPDTPEIRIPFKVRPARVTQVGRTPSRIPKGTVTEPTPVVSTAVPPQLPGAAVPAKESEN